MCVVEIRESNSCSDIQCLAEILTGFTHTAHDTAERWRAFQTIASSSLCVCVCERPQHVAVLCVCERGSLIVELLSLCLSNGS